MRLFSVFFFVSLAAVFGQESPALEKFNHAKWSATTDSTTVSPGSTTLIKLVAHIDPEWHMYSISTPPGPIPTSIQLANAAVAEVTYFQSPAVKKFDTNFNADTETYEGEATFFARVKWKAAAPSGPVTLTFEPRYQTCSGTSCIPPRTRQVPISVTIAAGPVMTASAPSGFTEAKASIAKPLQSTAATQPSDLGAFLLLAFGFGLAAIFTPCVFPMIPITMSYFVGQRGGFQQAIIFCLGIIVLFTGLGLLITILLGPSGVSVLGSNPWVNGFIALVFFVFGLSLLGAFELTIPSSVLTRMNDASGKGGFGGTLLMGLTFALASFACVGPFMGTLLAASVTGERLRPLLGMITFSTGLSLPFFFLALFPKYLQKMPRSGEWLSRVKVVMGFLVLAAMLKYLYSLDAVLQTGLLTRERFLAAWVVLFATAGFYLLGLIRLPGINRDAELGASRLIAGMLFVIFGISLVPGMFGSKLGEIEAYIPPPVAGSFASGGGGSQELAWIENDLPAAFAKAKAESKMLLVNFTGYACTNCHWMKANMFTRPEIASVMKNMILVDLYTDGTDSASKANEKLELEQFQTVAMPFYVLYDADRKVVATFPSLTRKPEQYLAFLNTKNASAAPAVNASAFEGGPFKTLTGVPIDVASWKGSVLVLNYWATWCIPCRKEIPEFNRMHRELSSKGVRVVGISMDEEGADPVNTFLAQTPIDYTVGLGTGALAPLPITVVIDRAGNTVQRFEGFTKPEDIRAAVNKAL